jgi:hypothetical protein
MLAEQRETDVPAVVGQLSAYGAVRTESHEEVPPSPVLDGFGQRSQPAEERRRLSRVNTLVGELAPPPLRLKHR